MPSVLVVDDDRDGAAMLRELLELEGCRAAAVFDGASAIQACASHFWELMLIDLHMPDMSGVELARHIGKAISPVPRMIALSGFSEREFGASGLDSPFERFLLKPVNFDDLSALLQRKQP